LRFGPADRGPAPRALPDPRASTGPAGPDDGGQLRSRTMKASTLSCCAASNSSVGGACRRPSSPSWCARLTARGVDPGVGTLAELVHLPAAHRVGAAAVYLPYTCRLQELNAEQKELAEARARRAPRRPCWRQCRRVGHGLTRSTRLGRWSSGCYAGRGPD